MQCGQRDAARVARGEQLPQRYRAVEQAARVAGYGDTTDVLRIPVGPFVYFMTAMILLSGLIHLYRALAPRRP